MSSLKEKVAVLKSPASSRHDQQLSLLFIIHLVGDAHQPMHNVDNGERGGNCVPVSFNYPGQSRTTTEGKDKNGNPNGSYSPNLHSVWDDSVIETMTGVEKPANRDQLTEAFAKTVANNFATEIKSEAAKKVNFEADFEAWALQAHKLAKPKSYDTMPKKIPVNPNPPTLKSCLGVSDKFVGLGEVAQGDFITQAQPVIEQQLARAGGRLAATLNSVWPD